MSRLAPTHLSLIGVGIAWLVAAPNLLAQDPAQCSALGVAEDVLTYDVLGNIRSDHRGFVTSWGCSTYHPSLELEARVTKNGNTLVTRDFTNGPPAELGASMEKILQLAGCDGLWRGYTKLGAPFVLAPDWFAAGASAPAEPSCIPPPPPPHPCGLAVPQTQTWSLDSSGTPVLTPQQLDQGLSQWEARTGGFYVVDQWAALEEREDGPAVELASSRSFRHYLEEPVSEGSATRVVDSLVDGAVPGAKRLVVQAPVHALNDRYIPMPSILPLHADLGSSVEGVAAEGRYWFRAEVSNAGLVDRVLILRAPSGQGSDAVREALRSGLKLQYADKRRHRVILFGVARVDVDRTLDVSNGLVVLPQCCSCNPPEGLGDASPQLPCQQWQ
jgi:hypothetical protein